MQPAGLAGAGSADRPAIAAMYGSRKTERPLAVEVRDRLGQWLADEDFAAAFRVRGGPGWAPSRLALVTVLQRAEKLTDRLAAEAVGSGWTGSTCSAAVDDPGFDHTVLAEFRGKVAEAGLEQVVLDALLDRLAADGLVTAGGRQRTDSTHVIAAVAALNRLELAGESVRAALEALAAAHPDWLAQRICVPDFARRYGTPLTSWRPPAPRPSAMSWRSPMPATGTRCLRRPATAPRRLAARPARSRCAAPGAGAELHPHHHQRRERGDQAAGEGA